jgi:hypothetical protein
MFVLKKDWYDFAPDIDLVEIHFTWTSWGEKPNWGRVEETRTLRVAPATSPTYRFCGIEIPRKVEGSERYDLHHFFVCVQGGREQVSPTYTEEIASQEITYEDWQGEYTLVGIRWAVGDCSFANYTLLELDGLGLELPQYQNPYIWEKTESSGLEFPQIYELVKSRSLPHVFRGKVHGPRGSLVQYHFHLLTLAGPAAEGGREVWNTNNKRNWMVTIV